MRAKVQAFQWSDQVQQADGGLEHYEFLAEGDVDPRREFAESLIARLSGAGTVVVYSDYEQARMKDLQKLFPDLHSPIQEVLSRNWVDLLKVVREHYYHPQFHGSYSIKAVLPALVPGFDYKDLAIQGGEVASLAFVESVDPRTSPNRRRKLRDDLLKYCGGETEAMVHIVDVLKAV